MQADNKFIKNKLGWAPNITFDDGLKTTIDWYRKFLKLYQKDNLFIKLQQNILKFFLTAKILKEKRYMLN